jgi:Tol biopolymer transport system component/tRNA A-37 threonylcarbamoyl transferase component Bud32
MSLEHLRASLADRYRIERELGAGGMATVYLAEDLKHDRKVAIKVLRPELAAVIGAERFLKEIKTTANLQHPHILGLIDSGNADGLLWYAMPFVQGESLRDRLQREKQLPIADAVRIATEAASALDYAHRHGVIHRDIKPENILLHDGSALVADFGIALAASTAGTRMTETGMSLGTPQYMSPEQAMGERELDARSDVYALGCVTYEMLTGEPPFSGPTAQAIVAKIMTAELADITTLRKTIPPHVADAVHTALQKLPADRYATAAEFAKAISQDARDERGETRRGLGPRRHASRMPASLSRLSSLLLDTAIAIAAFLLGGKLLGSHATVPAVLGHATHLTWDAGLEVTPALSPDGRAVAYAAGPVSNLHVMVRMVGGGRALRLTGDSIAESSPTWSADGSRIFFLSRGGVFSAPAGGGPARAEIPGSVASQITSATASPDGKRLAFTRGDSLLVREADATIRGVARMAEPTLCRWSPAEIWIACATGNHLYIEPGAIFGNLSPGRIVTCRVADGRLETVTDSLSLNTSPAWSPDGNWLYFVSSRDGHRDIYTIAIGSNGRSRRAPVRLSVGLGAHTISIAGTGTQIAYSQYTASNAVWMMPLPTRPGGTTSAATRLTSANETIEQFTPSFDGKWLYYDSNLPGNDDIFRIPIGTGEAERLTTDPADDFAPSPSPDGKAFAFHSWRSGSRDIFVQRLDGSGIDQVTHSPRQEAMPSWAPDGSALAFSEASAVGGISIVRRDAKGAWGEPVQRVDHGNNPFWSPDGRLLAFTSSIIGGGIEVVPADSGTARLLFDPSQASSPYAQVAQWASNDVVLFTSPDATGNFLIYSVPAKGGAPALLLRFDPVLHPAYLGTFFVRNGRLFFDSEDRQSDIWIIDVKKQ